MFRILKSLCVFKKKTHYSVLFGLKKSSFSIDKSMSTTIKNKPHPPVWKYYILNPNYYCQKKTNNEVIPKREKLTRSNQLATTG